MFLFKHKPLENQVQHEILKISGLGCEQSLGSLGKKNSKTEHKQNVATTNGCFPHILATIKP